MKRLIASVLVFALLCSCSLFSPEAFAASGTTYYVDSVAGDDANSGISEDAAWKTIEKASENTYAAGDKILFKAGGVYIGTFTARGSGTAEQPITISAYGDTETDGLPLLTTQEDTMLIFIHNVSGWCIENLEMTAPHGMGIQIIADNEIGVMKDFTIRNCEMHDIRYEKVSRNPGDSYSCIYISSSGPNALIENVTISDMNMYNSFRGIATFGVAIEWHRDIFVSPEESYNRNFLFENITMNNILYDAVIITAILGLTVRNCALLNTALETDWYTAPMWSHHAKYMLIENCEIAGSTNIMDGMAVDFDGWTTDSTYQYVYSHDNIRFMNNCVYDDTTKNANCTVRYCLSVNDNKAESSAAQLLSTPVYDYTINNDWSKSMENFKFYNNTIVNGSNIRFTQVSNSYVANNIFYSEDINQFFRIGSFGKTDDGKIFIRKFTGEFTNNCFYGCSIPLQAKKSVNRDPLFVGTDFTDKNSFKLAANSPLLGKGVQVEEDMGAYDFYGNPLTDTHNIGCYDGAGEDVVIEKSFADSMADFFKLLGGYIVGMVKTVIEAF